MNTPYLVVKYVREQ